MGTPRGFWFPFPNVVVRSLADGWPPVGTLKTTDYFDYSRKRPDRARILDEWIEQAVRKPVAENVQSDGRVQRWAFIAAEGRYLRVILLEDRETVHNAFFDRRFRP